jgi:hypothetical protein
MEVSNCGPSESWRRAFEDQATEETMAQVFGYASTYASMIEAVTQTRDPLIARELALDALADTFAGVVTWAPDKAPLVAHLCQVIRSRTSHELARAKRFRHVSLDRDTTAELEEDASFALASANDEREERAVVLRAHAALSAIRRLAARDSAVMSLLDAYEAGLSSREEITTSTGMSPRALDNAIRRMRRFAKKVPHDIGDAAIQASA